MDFMGIVQGDTVVLSKGPKPLKVDDFAQVVIQLRPSIVKEEEKKFKLHEGDETSSEEEEDYDYGFESDDSEDIKTNNSIFNDTGLLPKSKPLTPTQILATKLTGPQRIALGLGNLNVFATEDGDHRPSMRTNMKKHWLICVWLHQNPAIPAPSVSSSIGSMRYVRNAGSGACEDIVRQSSSLEMVMIEN